MKAAVLVSVLALGVLNAGAQQLSMKVVIADTVRPMPRFYFNTVTHSALLKTVLAPNQYARGLGFFCREEIKFQKAHVPLIFRVGSVEDCNRLEQKPGSR